MDLNEYQRLAMRTSPNDHDRIKNGCLGLIGESGEIVDLVKKHLFQSVPGTALPVNALINEMGDVLWYCMETITGIGDVPQIALTRNPIHSLFAVYTKSVKRELDLETAAVLLSLFSVNAYSACYFDDNVRFLRGSVFDVYSTLLCMCGMIGTTIEHVAVMNIEKLKKRYPDGFDPERSMNRPEYQCKEDDESAPGFLFNSRNRTI